MRREALSLLRFLPPNTAAVGDVTRDELREAGLGDWSETDVPVDDLRPPEGAGAGGDLPGYDRVVPADEERDVAPDEPVITLRFSAS